MPIIGAFIVPHPPIILPEVGRGEERAIEKTTAAYEEVSRRVAALKPETIVLTSPHSVMYADYFHISPGESASGDLGKFGVGNVTVSARYDEEFARTLTELAGVHGLPAGFLGERDKSLDHGTLIPLRFLNACYTTYKLVRIGLSGLPPLTHYALGKAIAEASDKVNQQIVLIASGDLSHKLKSDGPYGFAPEGPKFDQQVTQAMADGDFLQFLSFPEAFSDAAAECGLRSFQIMAGALDGRTVQAELLSYEGPFGVGYGVASFLPGAADANRRFDQEYLARERAKLSDRKSKEDPYVKLARHSLETYVRTGHPANRPDGLPAEMTGNRAGVFVSLKKHGRLRGCIGTIGPVTECVAEEILRNAVSAGCEDPRFDPVRPEELDELVYSVDVLSEAEPIQSPDALDVKRYGVIVTKGTRRGLLLPNLEGVDTVEQQISIAKQKAGLRPEDACSLERFEVIRHL